MSKIDNELFELCKGVYERTKDTWGWTDDLQWIEVNHFGEVSIFPKWRSLSDNSAEVQKHAPLYTSDYILEKLPPVIFVRTSDGKSNIAILTVWINGDKTAHVAYMIPFDEQNRGDYARESDTPLKALLKLVIALTDAGELS